MAWRPFLYVIITETPQRTPRRAKLKLVRKAP